MIRAFVLMTALTPGGGGAGCPGHACAGRAGHSGKIKSGGVREEVDAATLITICPGGGGRLVISRDPKKLGEAPKP